MLVSRTLWRTLISALGFGAVLGCASAPSPRASAPSARALAPSPRASEWQHQTRLAAESVRSGDPAGAVAHYEEALEAALEQEPSSVNQLAYANWHLGDACFRYPDSCDERDTDRRTQASLALFAEHYGPEHPVVIPILLRLSLLEARRGNRAAALDLLEQADRITTRAFPASHFMRVRRGPHRPAAQLHPLQLLKILAEVDQLDR